MRFYSTKTYGHEVGLSCCFRQWRATSHCNQLHGYALSVKLTFGCESLDETNWVMDFGGLKPIKSWLESQFDHTLVVANDDPMRWTFENLSKDGLAKIVVIDHVGCEAFAAHIARFVELWLFDAPWNEWRGPLTKRVWLHEVEVREHGANSAIWARK